MVIITLLKGWYKSQQKAVSLTHCFINKSSNGKLLLKAHRHVGIPKSDLIILHGTGESLQEFLIQCVWGGALPFSFLVSCWR